MKKNHMFKSVFLGILVFAMIGFVACKSYDEDLDSLKSKTQKLEATIGELNKKFEGRFLKDVTKDGALVFSDGKTEQLTLGAALPKFEIIDGKLYADGKELGVVKGKDGVDGKDGAAGKDGIDGKDGAVGPAPKVEVDPTTKEIIIGGVKTGYFQDGGSFVVDNGSSYTLSIWDKTTNSMALVVVPKAKYTLNNIALQGHSLNENGAKEVWFPIIVTDSIKTGFMRIASADFADAMGSGVSLTYKNFHQIYAGKSEFLLTMSPGAIQPDAFEMVGLYTNHKAKNQDGTYNDKTASVISNYNTYSRSDDECMLFNWGEALYSGQFNNEHNLYHYIATADGMRPYAKFSPADLFPIAPQKGTGDMVAVLALRAKAWALAERTQNNFRTQVSMHVKNAGQVQSTEWYTARRHAIMQKNVFITGKGSVTFSNPTSFLFVNSGTFANKNGSSATLIRNTDPYFRNSWNLNNGTNEMPGTLAGNLAVENREENKYYTTLANNFEIPLTVNGMPGTFDLKKIVRAYYFPSDAKGNTDTAEFVWVAEEGAPKESIKDPLTGLVKHNPFDDHRFEYELVDFYADGVNHSWRYLDPDMSKDGIITVREKGAIEDALAGGFPGGLHTAAIGRTPIVRIKMIAPGEDNNAVVKTAIVKFKIVKEAIKDITYEWNTAFELKSINQDVVGDMDNIFNATGIKKDPKAFKAAYEFQNLGTPSYKTRFAHRLGFSPVHDFGVKYADQVLLDEYVEVDPNKLNRLVLYVSPLAFEGTYTIETKLALRSSYNGGDLPQNINLKVNVHITYPKVVGPKKSGLNWQVLSTTGADEIIVSTGRYGKKENGKLPPVNPLTDTSYEMAQSLNTSFKIAEFESGIGSASSLEHARYATAYKAYGGSYTFDKEFKPRPTLSYELVGYKNSASLVPTGGNAGITLMKRDVDHGNSTYADIKASHWDLLIMPNKAGRAHIVRTQFNHTTGKFDYIEPAKKLIGLRAFISFNEWIDANYGSYQNNKVGYAASQINKFCKKDFVFTNIWKPTVKTADVAKYLIFPFAEIVGKDNYKDVSVAYGAVAPKFGRSAVVEEFQTIFAEPVRFRPAQEGGLVDKYEIDNNENFVVLDDKFVLTDYLYTDGILVNSKPKHIIYDFTYGTKVMNGVSFTDGWHDDYAVEFEAVKDISYKVGKVYYEADNTALDKANKERFKIYNRLVDGRDVNVLTWKNTGADAVKNLIVEVEVTVKHKWAEKDLGIALTYDEGTLASSTYKLKVKVVPHKEP